MFAFDDAADLSVGTFHIDDEDLRSAFAHISIEQLGIYGFRTFEVDGSGAEVSLQDPRRLAFEEMCRRFADHRAELSDFSSLCVPNRGFVANSVQSPMMDTSTGFNRLAAQFLSNRRYAPNRFPEMIDVVLFMGFYQDGFGVHRDQKDVTAFVLDGRKGMVIRDDDGADRSIDLSPGQYVKWSSRHWHGNRNPDRRWSMTMNFAVGPDDTRDVPVGTPVDYVHRETRLKDMLEWVAWQRSKRARSSPPKTSGASPKPPRAR
jgi:hypothetical protein